MFEDRTEKVTPTLSIAFELTSAMSASLTRTFGTMELMSKLSWAWRLAFCCMRVLSCASSSLTWSTFFAVSCTKTEK